MLDDYFNRDYSPDESINVNFFIVAGITVCVEHDLPPHEAFFRKKISAFAVDEPGEDIITLRHHFFIPDFSLQNLGEEVHRRLPWAVYRNKNTWTYCGILTTSQSKLLQLLFHGKNNSKLHRLCVFNDDHSHGHIFSRPFSKKIIKRKGFHSLSLMPTDQIWMCPVLAKRNALLIHSSAVILNGKGLVFVGHSDAGKSTTVDILKKAALKNGDHLEILCDDRNIIRKWLEGWQVHGTWSHGDIEDVSPSAAPLAGIFFLEKSDDNLLSPMDERKIIWNNILRCLIRSIVTAELWRLELDTMEELIREIPFFHMQFEKSGSIYSIIKDFVK